MQLFFNGVELLDEEATLLEYDVVPDDCPGGPVVHLGGSPFGSFDLQCLLPNGRLLKEQVTLETTVAQLKGRICSETGMPFLCMKLHVGAVELRDAPPLGRYGLSGHKAVQVSSTRKLYVGPAA